MRLSYNPETQRRCICCPNRGQPPLRTIVGTSPLGHGKAVVLDCGHIDASLDEFRELHPEWTWG